jgi:hypothetical protein
LAQYLASQASTQHHPLTAAAEPRTGGLSAPLAGVVRAAAELRGVLDLLVGKPDFDLATELTQLVKDEAVPYLAAHRYKEPGLRKRAVSPRAYVIQVHIGETTVAKHLALSAYITARRPGRVAVSECHGRIERNCQDLWMGVSRDLLITS